MITPANWKATSIDMHTNKVWILDGGDKDDYSHGESASTVEYSSWTSHCATLPQIRKNKRGGKVKLQSILIPQSDFDHAEKGDALHDIAEDMRAPSQNSSQNLA